MGCAALALGGLQLQDRGGSRARGRADKFGQSQGCSGVSGPSRALALLGWHFTVPMLLEMSGTG